MFRPWLMVDLGGLGEAVILGEKVGFKCQHHTESVNRVCGSVIRTRPFFFWNCIVRRLRETLQHFCGQGHS